MVSSFLLLPSESKIVQDKIIIIIKLFLRIAHMFFQLGGYILLIHWFVSYPNINQPLTICEPVAGVVWWMLLVAGKEWWYESKK